MRATTSRVTVSAPNELGLVDLTAELGRAVEKAGIREGYAVVFSTHTTCSLVVNELETGLAEDLTQRLKALVPRDDRYAHDDLGRRTENLGEHERRNGHAHVAQMLTGGCSLTIPVVGGAPAFGRWQRLMLLELDGPQERTVLISVFGA